MGNIESSTVDLVVSKDRKWFSLDKTYFYPTKRVISISIHSEDEAETEEKIFYLVIYIRPTSGVDNKSLRTNMMTREHAEQTLSLFTGPLLSTKHAKGLIKKKKRSKKNSTEEETIKTTEISV